MTLLTDQYKGINDEGMPQYQRPFMKGKLVIHFNVTFPEAGALTPEKCKILETILPSSTSSSSSSMSVDECEETILHDVNMEEEMRRKEHQRQQEAYDEDDDDEPGMQRVGCNQQ